MQTLEMTMHGKQHIILRYPWHSNQENIYTIKCIKFLTIAVEDQLDAFKDHRMFHLSCAQGNADKLCFSFPDFSSNILSFTLVKIISN